MVAVGDSSFAGGIFAGGPCGCERRLGMNPEKKCGLQRGGVVVFRLDDNRGALQEHPAKTNSESYETENLLQAFFQEKFSF